MRTIKIIALLLIVAVAGILLVKYIPSQQNSEGQRAEPNSNTQADPLQADIFQKPLSELGIKMDNLGFHSFSPDGKYFVFTGIKSSDKIPAKTYLADLSTSNLKELPGIVLRGFEDGRVIALFNEKDLVLYNVSTGETQRIATDGNIFAGALSPNGKYYVFQTSDGFSKYNLETKTTEQIADSQYSGASAWFSDNQRMIGWQDTKKNLYEAGNARRLGIWDVQAKTFSPLETAIPEGTIRNATWIIKDKVARINTGWDDGSHDYLLDVETKKVIDLGDTSGALMGGVTEDSSRGLFALINGYGDMDQEITAEIYRGMEKISSATLPGGYFRENVKIIDENSLLYIRKPVSRTGAGKSELVLLSLTDGTETPLKELSAKGYSTLSLHPDHNTWVINTDTGFLTGKLK